MVMSACQKRERIHADCGCLCFPNGDWEPWAESIPQHRHLSHQTRLVLGNPGVTLPPATPGLTIAFCVFTHLFSSLLDSTVEVGSGRKLRGYCLRFHMWLLWQLGCVMSPQGACLKHGLQPWQLLAGDAGSKRQGPVRGLLIPGGVSLKELIETWSFLSQDKGKFAPPDTPAMICFSQSQTSRAK